MTGEHRRLVRHGERNIFPHLLSLTFGLYVIAGDLPVSAAEPSLPVEFRMETNATRYEIGTPMLVRLTLRNVGEADFQIMAKKAGWGRSFYMVSRKNGGPPTPVPSDVPHVEDYYMPPYFFWKSLAPSEAQHIVHFVRTDHMALGQVKFMFDFFQRGRTAPTPDVPVEIVPRPKEEDASGPQAISAQDETFIYRYVPRRHNGFRRGRKTSAGRGPDHQKLLAIVRKSMASHEASLPCEYALYAGVLQAIDVMATDDDIELAEEAAETLARRFPDSWLRAYAYGMLCTVHLERGNSEKARAFAEKGLKLPESNPLFHNLGIIEKLEKLKSASGRERGNSS